MDLRLEVSPDGTTTLHPVSEGRGGKPGRRESNVRILVEYFLGETLESYVRRCRAEDPPRSWAGIAAGMEDRITRRAAELDPAAAPLVVRISTDLTYRLGQELGLVGTSADSPDG